MRINTPTEFDREVKSAYKDSSFVEVKRFDGILQFSNHVKDWLHYKNFGSPGKHSAHAIAQGAREKEPMHFRFYKDQGETVRMEYKYDELDQQYL